MNEAVRWQSAHRVAWAGAALMAALWTLLPMSPVFRTEFLARAVGDIQWIPFVERGRPPLWSDVLANLLLFAPFGMAGWNALKGRRRRLLLVLSAAALFSLAIETLQLALPARRTSATDLVMDVAGALVGVGVGVLWDLRGRELARGWAAAFGQGRLPNVFVVFFAVVLAAWSILPGNAADVPLWRRIQLFSSSFRHFPGWAELLAPCRHSALYGLLFSSLAARSFGGGRALSRGAHAAALTAALGLFLEVLQVTAPSRRPQIVQVLAFAAGGLMGAVVGVLPRRLAGMLLVLAAAAAALWWPLGGDDPAGPSTAAALIGLGLAAVATLRARP